MVFASPLFLFVFLPLFLLGYYVLPRRTRMGWIVVASWVFYGWWRPGFLPLLVGSSTGAALVARLSRHASRRGRAAVARRWTAVGVIAAIALLGWYKYAGFVASTADRAFAWLGLGRVAVPDIVLPIGISFFTFQIVSFLVDVQRGTAPYPRRLVDVLAYVSLFPQLIAGPIVRYGDIADQLVDRPHSIDRVSGGLARFMVGLARKVLIADAVAPIVDAVFSHPAPGLVAAWLGTAAYAIQIYFDFAAYSDMAIGLGRMIGFTFPENFNLPYHSRSITEFWRRWHMTLSRWLRDYLYVPLGGSRRGDRRTLINLMTVMVIGGLWHGAAWTFVVWGAWHGVALVVERVLGVRGGTDDARLRFQPLRRVVTLLVVLVGWVLFRSEGLADATSVLAGMAGGQGVAVPPSLRWQFGAGSIVALLVGLAVVVTEPVLHALARDRRAPWAALQTSFVVLAFGASLARVLSASYSPFLYFQF